jgi:hypothetical protein
LDPNEVRRQDQGRGVEFIGENGRARGQAEKGQALKRQKPRSGLFNLREKSSDQR